MNNLNKNLDYFTGTEHYYRLNLTDILATDGVYYFAKQNKCFWLIDEICWSLLKLKEQPFVVINIKSKNKKAILHFEDGNGKKLRNNIKIDTIDLPEGEIDIWKETNVLLLPSEH